MEILLFAILLGLAPAAIARNKGRSFFGWWIYGALLFIVALPHSLLMRPDHRGQDEVHRMQGLVKCPFCAEFIRPEAIVCRHCGRDLRPEPKPIIDVPVTSGPTQDLPVRYSQPNPAARRKRSRGSANSLFSSYWSSLA